MSSSKNAFSVPMLLAVVVLASTSCHREPEKEEIPLSVMKAFYSNLLTKQHEDIQKESNEIMREMSKSAEEDPLLKDKEDAIRSLQREMSKKRDQMNELARVENEEQLFVFLIRHDLDGVHKRYLLLHNIK